MEPSEAAGFILGTLKNYTTCKFYRLVKAIKDDPEVNKKQATSQLARFTPTASRPASNP